MEPDLGPLVGRAEPRGVSRGDCGLRKSFSAACLLMVGQCSRTHLLFGLRRPTTKAYRLLSGARSPYQGPKISASDASQSSHRPLLCLPSALMSPERATVVSLPL